MNIGARISTFDRHDVYDRVEYIVNNTSDTKCSFSTGVKSSSKLSIVGVFDAFSWLFGGRDTGGANSTGVMSSSDRTTFFVQHGGYNTFSDFEALIQSKYKLTLTPTDFTIESDAGTLTKSITSSSYTAQNYVYLGTMNTAGTLNNRIVGKIYSFKMWEDGVLVRDFVPIVKDGVGQMVDVVNDVVYKSTDSNQFGYGGTVSKLYVRRPN